jgi:hypothetical protein
MHALYRAAIGFAIVICTTLAGAGAASIAITPAAATTTQACSTPHAADGATITINPHTGNADAPATPGGIDYACAHGQWIRIYIPSPLPRWARYKVIRHDACGRGDGPGIVVWAAHADQSVLICRNGQINPS